jgi:hypothetical protein
MSLFREIAESLSFAKAFLILVADPDRTEQIFKMAELGIRSRDRRGARAVLDRAMGDPDFAECWRERYLAAAPDLGALARCPRERSGKSSAARCSAPGSIRSFTSRSTRKPLVEVRAFTGTASYNTCPSTP